MDTEDEVKAAKSCPRCGSGGVITHQNARIGRICECTACKYCWDSVPDAAPFDAEAFVRKVYEDGRLDVQIERGAMQERHLLAAYAAELAPHLRPAGADDGEDHFKVTEAWLRKIGLSRRIGEYDTDFGIEIEANKLSLNNQSAGGGLDGEWWLYLINCDGFDGQEYSICHVHTRGQLRALMAALKGGGA